MEPIYQFNSYKTYFNHVVSESDWGGISRLADAAGCQRSYFSRALRGEVQLTPDHVAGVCEYLKLDEEESDFLMTLLEYERASSLKYRKKLKDKLDRLKAERENLGKRLHRPKVRIGEREMLYYSVWYHSAIHILTSIPAFQTAEKISKHLSLPVETVISSLQFLESVFFVQHREGKWKYFGNELHVSKDSALVSLHHQNWRQRAVHDSQNKSSESIHFTAVYSVSVKTAATIKEKLLEFIDNATKEAGPSEPEQLITLNCDFFKV